MAGRFDVKELWGKVRDRAMSPRHPGGMAVLRIALGAVILGEVLQLVELEGLIFPRGPIPETAPIIGLAIWGLSAVAITAGAWTRQAVIVNWACTLIHVGVLRVFEYHHDYVLMGLSTLLLLMPIERAWSIDAWRTRRGDPQLSPCPEVLQLHHDMIVFFGIALVYFDSIFFKFSSPMWRNGLGVWMPASLPYTAARDFSFLLDIEFLIVGLGYVTLVFETVFIVLMWWRKAHLALFLVGIGLHLGIVITLPIPWFGLGVAALYVLLLPDVMWRKLDPDTPVPTVSTLAPWRGKLIVALMVIGFFSQLALIGGRTNFSRIFTSLEMGETLSRKPVARGEFGRLWFSGMHHLMGVTNHPVFMDRHFQGYEHLFTLKVKRPGQDSLLVGPLDERGRPVEASSGRMWVYFTFRFNGPGFNVPRLKREVERYTRFWVQSQGMFLNGTTFEIYHRRVDVPKQWEEGWLRSQMDQPWTQVGEASWNGGRMSFGLQPPIKKPTAPE